MPFLWIFHLVSSCWKCPLVVEIYLNHVHIFDLNFKPKVNINQNQKKKKTFETVYMYKYKLYGIWNKLDIIFSVFSCANPIWLGDIYRKKGYFRMGVTLVIEPVIICPILALHSLELASQLKHLPFYVFQLIRNCKQNATLPPRKKKKKINAKREGKHGVRCKQTWFKMSLAQCADRRAATKRLCATQMRVLIVYLIVLCAFETQTNTHTHTCTEQAK